jgi:hypothetical protein
LEIVLVDDGVQTLKIWWEKSLQGEISDSAENLVSHLDVLSLEYLERPENFRWDNENTGPSLWADQGRDRSLQ